ncbi:MAG: zinc-binding alcohol dehydrogenase [Marinilabiliales bacterium]|nr:MAG: zinc-binding alcohol dehydrogenase [Marinilabiliales bacterium]
MKAVIINQFGNPDVFQIGEIDIPKINNDQLLIKVNSVGINPIDWKQRKGNHKLILGSPFPIVLGYDLCGEVVQVGDEIKRFKNGDMVFGALDNKYGGAMAEFAVGHENCFSLKPVGISINEAAAFPMVSLTALQALRDKANLKPGDSIIINGASGGVGHIAVQISKLMGAKVIAIASERSWEFVMQFKPDEFLNYNNIDITKQNKKVDVFFDVIGTLSFPKVKHLLKSGGIYLNLNYLHSLTKIPVNVFHQFFSNRKKAKSLLMKHDQSDMELITNWINENKLKVSIDTIFQMDQIKQAHEYAQHGHNKGKNVIVISE